MTEVKDFFSLEVHFEIMFVSIMKNYSNIYRMPAVLGWHNRNIDG